MNTSSIKSPLNFYFLDNSGLNQQLLISAIEILH